jgi:hypothetical protein
MRGAPRKTWTKAITLALIYPLLACVPAQKAPPPTPQPTTTATVKPVRPRPPLNATWSFEVDETACIARATAGATKFRIAVSNAGAITIDLAPGSDGDAYLHAAQRHHAQIKIAAAGANWRWLASPAPPAKLSANLPPSKTSLAQILLLLEGGNLTLNADHLPDRVLHVPPAESAGAEWFACAKERAARSPGAGD